MQCEDVNLYLEKKLYNEDGSINHELFYVILQLNLHLIPKVLKYELNIHECIREIDLEDIYDLGLYALGKAIINFDPEEDDIEEYYYDYLVDFFTIDLADYLEGSVTEYEGHEEEQITKWKALGSKLNRTLEDKFDARETLRPVLNDEENAFLDNVYCHGYTADEILEMIEDEDSILNHTISDIVNKIDNTLEEVNIDFRGL